MKTTMTERDKRLLLFMSVFVIIVAIGYWGIYPQYKRFRKLEAKIEKEEEEKKINQLKIANLAGIEVQADDYEKKISEKKDEFYQVLKSSEIDKMMTELASRQSLDIYELSFNMPQEPTERMAYQYSELYNTQKTQIEEYLKNQELEQAENESKAAAGKGTTQKEMMEEIMGPTEGGYQPNTDIYAVPVTMTVGGDLENLHRFINDIITSDKRILLVGYTWGEFRDVIRRDAEGNIITTVSGNSSDGGYNSTAESVEVADGNQEGVSSEDLSEEKLEVIIRKSLTVKLEIYMCDTSNVASAGDAAPDEDGSVDTSSESESDTEDIDSLLDE